MLRVFTGPLTHMPGRRLMPKLLPKPLARPLRPQFEAVRARMAQ